MLDQVAADQVSELVVFFLTDGEDMRRSATIIVAEKLKLELRERNIPSKFCVMGLERKADNTFLY